MKKYAAYMQISNIKCLPFSPLFFYIYCYFRVGGGDGKAVKAAWVPLVNGEEFLLLVDIRKTIFEVIPLDLDCKNYKHVPVF